jgi:hypothetical protein
MNLETKKIFGAILIVFMCTIIIYIDFFGKSKTKDRDSFPASLSFVQLVLRYFPRGIAIFILVVVFVLFALWKL